jgi:asparagine synthase (glutamine-hydrolysing)
MSGILCVWQSQTSTPWQAMLDDLTVLGSDGRGDWHDPLVGLKIGRTQCFNTPESVEEPPIVEAEGCILAWDGRLDDRDSLLGGRSASISDAQLIIESYRRWGSDCIRQLTGEFAFVLWDASQALLLAGCDVTGGRTIAYYWDGRTLLLSSRLLTLLHHPQVDHQLDELYLAHGLWGSLSQPADITPFANLKRLQPGWALILRSGKLQQRQIAAFTAPDFYPPAKPEASYEQFWYLLNQAIRDRLRTRHRMCVTLSGGLDSTTVAVSLLQHLPAIDAFSMVTDCFPEFDERESIEAFLQHYAQVRWHSIQCDAAWALSEPWHQLSIPDDPLIPCTTAMNLHMMQQIQASGYGLVFDGEGGDELFCETLPDLVQIGAWRSIIQRLKSDSHWRSTFWYTFILPLLSQRWQAKWFARCQRRVNPLPAWIASAYAQTVTMQTVLQQHYAGFLPNNLVDGINWSLSSGYSIASKQLFRVLQADHRLEFTSPFLDRRLIEFAIQLHPSLHHYLDYTKIFLRQVNQTTLPDTVRWRPKENYFDPVKYAGLGKGETVLHLLEQLKVLPFVQDRINIEQVEAHLLHYRQGYQEAYQPGHPYCNGEANALYGLFSFVNWFHYVNDRYLCRRIPLKEQI